MIIIGTHFFTWGSDRSAQPLHCGQCGAVTPFLRKQGIRCVTLFFILPIIPISGVKHFLQCPTCGARYQTAAA